MLRLENMIFKVVANRKHGISKTLKQASINYNEESRERKSMNKKKSQKHIETTITTPLTSSNKS